MTHFGDSFYSGSAFTNVNDGGFSSGGMGFGPIGRIYVWDFVPLTLNASAYAASQSPGSAALTLSAGTGITIFVDAFGVTRYVADVPRAVTITSGGNDSGIAFLIRGYDLYNQPLSQLLTGANAGVVTTKKTFKSVISITPTGTVASTVTAGTSDVFGLPVAIVDAGYVAGIGWNNTLSDNAGTLVNADVTSPATNLTGDVRGTFIQAGAASNGVRRLVGEILLSAAQSGISQTVVGVLGQPQA